MSNVPSAFTSTPDSPSEEAELAASGIVPGNALNIGQLIAKGIAEGMAALNPKKKTIGQYMREMPKKPALKRIVRQNGYEVDKEKLTAAEITAVNKITRGGRYLDRKVEVIIRDDSDPGMIEFRYHNQTMEQRLAVAQAWRDFTDLCKRIVMEQEVEDENAQLVKLR